MVGDTKTNYYRECLSGKVKHKTLMAIEIQTRLEIYEFFNEHQSELTCKHQSRYYLWPRLVARSF